VLTQCIAFSIQMIQNTTIHFLSAVHVVRKQWKIHRISAELNQWYFFRNASPHHRRRNVIAGRKHARRACTYRTLRAVKLNPHDSQWINYRPLGFIRDGIYVPPYFWRCGRKKKTEARVLPAGTSRGSTCQIINP